MQTGTAYSYGKFHLSGATDRVDQLAYVALADGADNTRLGLNAGFATGERSTAVGSGAGNPADSATDAVLVGAGAGERITGVTSTVAVGVDAAADAASLTESVLVGSGAGRYLERSERVCAVGHGAAGRMQTGLRAVAVGALSGYYATGLSDAVLVGDSSGMNCRSGEGVVLVGAGAGLDLEATTHTVAVGAGAAERAQGDALTAVGYRAAALAVGSSNVVAGTNLARLTGNANVLLGVAAAEDQRVTGDSNAVCATGCASVTGSHNALLGTGAGAVGGSRNVVAMACAAAAGAAAVTGDANVVVGASPAGGVTGSSNLVAGTRLGALAGGSNVVMGSSVAGATGSDNVVVGTGVQTLSGSSNVVLGTDVTPPGHSDSLSNCVVVGTGVDASAASRLGHGVYIGTGLTLTDSDSDALVVGVGASGRRALYVKDRGNVVTGFLDLKGYDPATQTSAIANQDSRSGRIGFTDDLDPFGNGQDGQFLVVGSGSTAALAARRRVVTLKDTASTAVLETECLAGSQSATLNNAGGASTVTVTLTSGGATRVPQGGLLLVRAVSAAETDPNRGPAFQDLVLALPNGNSPHSAVVVASVQRGTPPDIPPDREYSMDGAGVLSLAATGGSAIAYEVSWVACTSALQPFVEP